MSSTLVKSDINDYLKFYSLVADIISNETVQEMKKYRQHYDTTTYEHCFNVSFISYKICKKLKLDYVSVARAAMLHDLFLYDWRGGKKADKFRDLHAFSHPKTALENALKLFDLNKKEKDIIVKHMWPVTFSFPKYPESFIVTFVDKFSALQESFIFYNNFLQTKKLYKYAYVFFCLLILA